MKLLVYTSAKYEASEARRYRVGALVSDDEIVDLTALSSGSALTAEEVNRFYGDYFEGLEGIASSSTQRVKRGDVRIVSPVPRPGKIICIGLNYLDHAIESGMEIPKSPITFSKYSSCVVGPDDAIEIPAGSTQTDYESELAFVIGKRAKNVSADDAFECILGYTNLNDVSARDFQFADGQWQRGKACDTFAPMGEFIATKDEIPDPHALRIMFRLNGETLQDSSTGQLIFKIPALVEFLTRSITLEPGDVIATGTPPGVGFARKPPIYLKSGDVCEVEIQGLGVLRNPVK